MPATLSPIRWGLIGPGRIAHKFAEALASVGGAQLHAVVSRSRPRAQAFADQYNAPAAYDAVEALAEDPAVDAVYIATPHRFHAEAARACLEARKAVLCEKPLTVNAAEAEQVIAAARRHQVFLMEAVWSRFLPIYQQVRAWLEAGIIGPVRMVTSNFGVRMRHAPSHRVLNHDLAGGSLLDLGIYNVALTQFVLGRNPTGFDAHGLIGPTGVDDVTSAQLYYADQTVAQFNCSFRAMATNDLHISGEEGHIRVHPRFWGATTATLTTENDEQTVHKPFRCNGFEYEIEATMRGLRTGHIESTLMSHADTLANLHLMDAIRERIGLRYDFEQR